MAGLTKVGQFLKSRGSDQNEAAELLGIAVATFSLKANGKYPFKSSEIRKLAARYEMTDCEIINVFELREE